MATTDEPQDHGHMTPGPEEPAQQPTTEPASQVLIRAGVPGKPDLKVAHGKPYPNTTTDVAKLLAERGLTVTYEDEKDQRSYVSFYAAEIWIPILQVASSILAGASGNLLSEVIKQLLGLGKEKSTDTILHVDYSIVPRKGPKKTFKASGKADDVLKAMDKFEQEARDD
jgi:hypothetical protein